MAATTRRIRRRRIEIQEEGESVFARRRRSGGVRGVADQASAATRRPSSPSSTGRRNPLLPSWLRMSSSSSRIAAAAVPLLALLLMLCLSAPTRHAASAFSSRSPLPSSLPFRSSSPPPPTATTGLRAASAAAAATDEPQQREQQRRQPAGEDAAGSGAAAAADPIARRTVGNWEELHGNFLLRPSVESGAPRALVHFLGGAIVGAAPHVSYRYLLERLAAEGYLVVATPYSLSFDHLATCDAVISRFERIAPLLARTYGALPVVGVGHSCGALLQVLISSLFPDTPRAANALISFNNKPVSEAVPFFEELFVPFFTYAAARNDTTRNSGSEIISVALRLAKASVAGELPSDELLSRAVQLMTPPGGGGAFPFMSTDDKSASIPDSVREGFRSLAGPLSSAAAKSGALPVAIEALEILEQIPLLIDEVADGARDFNPQPDRVKAAARRAYRARRTMVLQYDDDPIDESDEIEELLGAAQQIIRMKRPMVQIDVQRRNLGGGHAAPLLAPPLDVAARAETILSADVAKERLLYTNAAETVEEITRWLEESNL